MSPSLITTLFLVFLILNAVVRFWLSLRQQKHVLAHRATVPEAFAQSFELKDHQRAADYTVAKLQLGRIDLCLGLVWILLLTLAGGLQLMTGVLTQYFNPTGIWFGLALFLSFALVGFVWDLPLTLYQTFVLEERFGFNRTTAKLFIVDLLKGTALGVAIGGPLLALVLWLMGAAGNYWWVWTWGVLIAVNLLMMVIYPLFIAPWYNKFEPLQDIALTERVNALLLRCGFRCQGLFVMDGSRRSAHTNAYFTGFGAGKRIVFFDTLLKSLTPAEIEAVLAHELGHFKHRHLWQRVVLMGLIFLPLLALLGWLSSQEAFYLGLGIRQGQGAAMALLLFSLVLPAFTFPFTPLMSFWSRKREFEADAYAVSQTQAEDLVSALVKLYRENASTLTPDPIHSLFYDSHPPAAIRIGRLRA